MDIEVLLYTNYMEELYETLIRERIVYIPIRKIDEMLVNARMFVTDPLWPDGPYIFYIEFSLHDGTEYIDSGTTYKDFCSIIEGLKDMKFDTLTGEFKNPNKLTKTPCTKRLMSMFHHPNIEMEYSECCVCYEVTYSKTPHCNHTLCMRCYMKLTTTICPICRASTAYDTVD